MYNTAPDAAHSRTVNMLRMFAAPSGGMTRAEKSKRTRERNKEQLRHDLNNPSERRDFVSWKRLDDHYWRRKQYLGFYLSQYRRVFKSEDRFFVDESLASPKQRPNFYQYSTIILNFCKKNNLSVHDFRKYTVFALRKCTEYSKNFPDTKWFFTIYSKEKMYETYKENAHKAF